MAATNRTDKIKQLFKILQKRYKHFPKPPSRKLLEHLMFAACLENASFEATESAYSVLEHHYIDWNELRVSTPQEIADTLPMLPDPLLAGERIKKTLQWVFETSYMFDLEEYHKKTIGQTVEYLDSIPSCTPFMTNYVVQIGLGGHQIPLDEAAMRILRRLDLTKVNENKEETIGIERVITKTQGIEFGTILHIFGVEFFNTPNATELLTVLKGIDPGAEKRSWQEPEGLIRKTDLKIVPPRPASHIPNKFKPEIELEDDDLEPVDPVSAEDSIEFIDHGLASLANGSKESNFVEGVKPASKKEKQTADKQIADKPAEPSVAKRTEQEDELKTTTKPSSAVSPVAEPLKSVVSPKLKPQTASKTTQEKVSGKDKTPAKAEPKKTEFPQHAPEKISGKQHSPKSKACDINKPAELKTEKTDKAESAKSSAKKIEPVKQAPRKPASQKPPATKQAASKSPKPAMSKSSSSKNGKTKPVAKKDASKPPKKAASKSVMPPKKNVKKTSPSIKSTTKTPQTGKSHTKKLLQKKPR